MIVHAVVFRWNEGMRAELLQQIEQGLGELPSKIGAIRSYRFGPNAKLMDGNFDFGIVATFDDDAGFKAYAQDPDHLRVATELIRPNMAERAAIQFRTE